MTQIPCHGTLLLLMKVHIQSALSSSFKADKEEGYSYFHTFHILYFAMIQPPEPGQSTRQSTLPFAIPSIIMDGGGQYPPFFDVCS